MFKYWMNAKGILDPRLCGSSETCLGCKLSVDQVTTWPGIFSAFSIVFSYRFLTPCFIGLLLASLQVSRGIVV